MSKRGTLNVPGSAAVFRLVGRQNDVGYLHNHLHNTPNSNMRCRAQTLNSNSSKPAVWSLAATHASLRRQEAQTWARRAACEEQRNSTAQTRNTHTETHAQHENTHAQTHARVLGLFALLKVLPFRIIIRVFAGRLFQVVVPTAHGQGSTHNEHQHTRTHAQSHTQKTRTRTHTRSAAHRQQSTGNRSLRGLRISVSTFSNSGTKRSNKRSSDV